MLIVKARKGLKPWAEADDRRLRDAVEEGCSSWGVMLRLQNRHSRGQIEARAAELGLTFKRHEQISRGQWTLDREQLAKKLWDEGLSATQIGYRLGGITRNAVIGKLHRLGVSGRSRPALTAAARHMSKSSPRMKKARQNNTPMHLPRPRTSPTQRLLLDAARDPLPLPRDTDIARISHVELDDKPITITLANGDTRTVKKHCKWPCADPREVGNGPLYCGDQRVPGLPYCEHHALRAFNAGATAVSGNKLPAPKMPQSMASPLVLCRSPA